MLSFATALTYWLAPALALLYPYVAGHRRLAPFLPRVPRLPGRRGFQGMSHLRPASGCETWPRMQSMATGLFLFGVTLFTMQLVRNAAPPSTIADGYVRACASAVLGYLLGMLALSAYSLFQSARTAHRAAALLEPLGISGVWGRATPQSSVARFFHGGMTEIEQLLKQIGVPALTPSVTEDTFQRELVATLRETQSLDAISIDGLDVLRLFLRDPSKPELGPHPHLRGLNVRLLVLPPRNSRVDPERQRVTCSEVALTRLERSPEEHWRQLKHFFAVQKSWTAEFDMSFEVRFLESRPVFAYLKAGGRTWVQPWMHQGPLWLEMFDLQSRASMAGALHGFFASEWAEASTSINVALQDGATGSTAIRKGALSPRSGADPRAAAAVQGLGHRQTQVVIRPQAG